MSSSILEKIILEKKSEVATRALNLPLNKVKELAEKISSRNAFSLSLKNAKFPAIIAEVKKASPSRGILREDFDPEKITREYISHGATCLSVLTDEKFFQGKLDDLRIIRKSFPQIPILRKDFIIHNYQIWEAKAAGADCILLIVAALSKNDFKFLLEEVERANLDVLIEVHNKEELDIAFAIINQVYSSKKNLPLLGINNRNLNTFETSLDTTKYLLDYATENTKKLDISLSDLLVVAESGIKNADDLKLLFSYGAKAFLIGESLITKSNIGESLKFLINESQK